MNNLENESRFNNLYKCLTGFLDYSDFTLPSSYVMYWAKISQG